MADRDLFRHDPHRDGNTLCVLCGKRFRRRNAMHGLAHAKRGEVTVSVESGALGGRYRFTVPTTPHQENT